MLCTNLWDPVYRYLELRATLNPSTSIELASDALQISDVNVNVHEPTWTLVYWKIYPLSEMHAISDWCLGYQQTLSHRFCFIFMPSICALDRITIVYSVEGDTRRSETLRSMSDSYITHSSSSDCSGATTCPHVLTCLDYCFSPSTYCRRTLYFNRPRKQCTVNSTVDFRAI